MNERLTSLEEEHVVVVGDLEELAHVGNQLLEDGLDGAINVTVGAFHEVHAWIINFQYYFNFINFK